MGRGVFVFRSNRDTSSILGDSDAKVLQCLELSYMMKNFLLQNTNDASLRNTSKASSHFINEKAILSER